MNKSIGMQLTVTLYIKLQKGNFYPNILIFSPNDAPILIPYSDGPLYTEASS